MRTARIVVVDDHEIVRSGLHAILSREPDIRVVGMAASGEDGLRLIEEVEPDLAVVDYSLGGMSGVELCERVGRRWPDLPVIMLSISLDDTVIQRSLEAGAKAYVYKDIDARDLKETIRMVHAGEAVLDPKIAGRVMGWAVKEKLRQGEQILSARETEVLRLVARGASNAMVAEALGVTQNTVKTYLRRAILKLDCRTRSEAVAVASKRGLL